MVVAAFAHAAVAALILRLLRTLFTAAPLAVCYAFAVLVALRFHIRCRFCTLHTRLRCYFAVYLRVAGLPLITHSPGYVDSVTHVCLVAGYVTRFAFAFAFTFVGLPVTLFWFTALVTFDCVGRLRLDLHLLPVCFCLRCCVRTSVGFRLRPQLRHVDLRLLTFTVTCRCVHTTLLSHTFVWLVYVYTFAVAVHVCVAARFR